MKKKAKFIVAGTTAGILTIAAIAMRQYSLGHQDGTSESIIGEADEQTSVIITEQTQGGNGEMSYTSITMKEAGEIFATGGDYIILDVRRADEFAAGHIPGAINVANENILDAEPAELPNKAQTIYVYCRSGRRSREAASKLASMGYSNIIECGGILDWTGEIEK